MIKIKSIMTKNVIAVSPDSSISEAAKILASKEVSGLIVVEKKKPIAVISENNIIKGLITKKTKVRDVMSRDFKVISPTTKFSEVSRYLKEKNIKRFPVIENEEFVGLITEIDIIEATRDFTRVHQVVQDIILTIFGLATAFFLFYFSPLRATLFG